MNILKIMGEFYKNNLKKIYKGRRISNPVGINPVYKSYLKKFIFILFFKK